MSLFDLPPEIIHRIFGDLTTANLLSLVTTCKRLNTFAENHLWRCINLLVPHNAPDGDDPADEANLDWSRRRLSAIVTGLQKRVNHVKVLKCQITNENWSDLAQCLLCIQESLVDLRIQSCPFRQLWSHSSRTNSVTLLFNFLVKTKPTIPSMRTLRLPLEHHYEALFVLLLEASSNLNYVLIDRPRQTQWFPDRLPTLPVLLHLTRFKVEMLDRDHMPFVSHILHTSPKLSTVSFKQGLDVSPRTTWSLELRDLLGAMPRLHTLEIDQRLLGDYGEGSFQNLRYLKLRQEYRNCFSHLFSTIEIPPLPALQILELHPGRMRTTSKFLSVSKSFPCTLGSASPREVELAEPLTIPLTALRQLEGAPCLRRIILTTSLTTPDPITSEIQLKDFHEDIVVRRWNLPQGVFTWVKSWSHIVEDPSGEVMHLDYEAQQDWVDLGGGCLTSSQLEETCRLAGIDRDWVTPEADPMLTPKGLMHLHNMLPEETGATADLEKGRHGRRPSLTGNETDP